jgi:hypothetical protein
MSKYHNRKVTEDGYTFDSVAEYNRYRELKTMQNNGDIKSLAVHPTYILQKEFNYHGKLVREVKYIADFVYYDVNDHILVIEDVKGVQTAEFKIKAKLFQKLMSDYTDVEFRLVQV